LPDPAEELVGCASRARLNVTSRSEGAKAGDARLGLQAHNASRLISDPVLKRIFDCVFAGLGLVFGSFLWPLISLLIWLEDGRPILFRQERIGRNGKSFFLLKFRTMWKDAQGVGLVVDRDFDPRVTRTGRLLRATALDELPQLLNIFRGDMSFVGPRALPLKVDDHEATRYRTIEDVEGYEVRASVRPGLTGIAQIFAPKTAPRRAKFKYDLFYIKRWSFGLDLRLVAMSVSISLRGKWEKRTHKV